MWRVRVVSKSVKRAEKALNAGRDCVGVRDVVTGKRERAVRKDRRALEGYMRTENVRQSKTERKGRTGEAVSKKSRRIVVEREAESMGDVKDKGRGQGDGGHGAASKERKENTLCAERYRRYGTPVSQSPDGERRYNTGRFERTSCAGRQHGKV